MKYKKLRGVLLIGREVKLLKDEEIVWLIISEMEYSNTKKCMEK